METVNAEEIMRLCYAGWPFTIAQILITIAAGYIVAAVAIKFGWITKKRVEFRWEIDDEEEGDR